MFTPTIDDELRIACEWIGYGSDHARCQTVREVRDVSPGFIPTQVGLLIQLTLLDLILEALAGSIPSEFGRLTQLTA